MTETIKAKKRTDTGKGVARKLRAAGMIPGVMYGAIDAPMPLTMLFKDIDPLVGQDGESGLIDVLVEDDDGKEITREKAVIRHVDYHPEKDVPIHIDFLSVAMDKEISVSVPVELIGEAVGVITNRGIQTQITHEIEVECLPGLLPSSIQVDISELEIGDSIHVRDLAAIEGVKIKSSESLTVATIEAPRAEEVVEVEEEELLGEEVEGEEEAAPEEGEESAGGEE